MKIINLIENTEGSRHCACEHGLSFYIETEKHTLLMDTGASGLLLENAKKLGVELTKVDTVVLSHGHYDHGGGILPFVQINPDAVIYLHRDACRAYYSTRWETKELRYVGLDPAIRELKQAVFVTGTYRIDDELTLFSDIGSSRDVPDGNRALKVRVANGGGYELIQDDFRHEQCLVISEGNKKVLLSGCAHHGILNVMDRFRELFGEDPDVVISGFHMMKHEGYTPEDEDGIIRTARALREYRSVFYTGHCTDVKPFEDMKKIMGDQLLYVHCADEIPIFEEAGK